MIKFLKIRDVKDPKRNFGDAGIDVYVPEYNEDFINDLLEKNQWMNSYDNIDDDGILVDPHCSVLIPAGIKSRFDSNISLVAHNKSGVCVNTQLIVGAQVIDSSYTGEWHIHVINTSDKLVRIRFGTKLVQFLPLDIDIEELEISHGSEEEFYKEFKTTRADGGFGSTGLD